ncbi:DUF4082 domain-containing protein [Acuticoccus sediminis]|uniref:DUF4082 domain-containing protein n=1 Tax=Acuticoccus sediminis TaxID=2184697 RepID=UPI001CFDAC8C|nr:DUF4082 domain-containing protein [Acuticoccus sediminis]
MPDNRITLENAITEGRAPQSYWDANSSDAIEGFATDISVNAGDTVDFKINVNGNPADQNAYKVEIFRLGYYGGDGARQVAELINDHGTVQDLPLYDESRGLVDAGNWLVTDSWDVPDDMVSGVFLARLQMLDANGDPIDGETNQIPFIVRNDGVAADIVLQTSDTTWQAYNGWCGKLSDVLGNGEDGGPNFYGDRADLVDHDPIDTATGLGAQDRAYAVSYNRPIATRDFVGAASGPQDYLFGADYAAVNWLEKNGYDVSYISGVDTDRLGADYLKNYEAYISVGHDEYWSGDQRANVAEARDAGVNLVFWSGNECYWKTRYEPSISSDATDYRTLVCYKETWAVADPNAGPDDYYNLDPTDIWTGTWQDVRFVGNEAAGAGDLAAIQSGLLAYCHCGQNALIGQLFIGDGTGEFGAALDVPSAYSGLRVWRDTSVAANGGAQDLSPGIIGYEWDYAPDDANRPAGLVKLSETSVDWSGLLVDDGNTTAPGTETHTLTIYRAESGALVFAAGTVFWSWALSNEHDGSPYGGDIENTALQQLSMNIFADMGIQPGVSDLILASQGLVRASASTDTVAATASFGQSTILAQQFDTITLTGTATDNDGNPLTDDGAVALVEVSLDGGDTWRPATGTSSWSYKFFAQSQGTFDVLVRAIDDSLNTPSVASLASATVTIEEPDFPSEVSLFDTLPAVTGSVFDDGTTLTLGTRFVTTVSGAITELHYYRAVEDTNDTDVRIGRLYSADGTLLGQATFTSTPGQSGWQTAVLPNPVTVTPGAEYVVAYTTDDNYMAADGFFNSSYSEPFGLLSAPSGGAGNGLFTTGSGFPTSSYHSTNYWVDVTLATSGGGETNAPPVFTGLSSFSIAENGIFVTTVTASDSNFDPLTFAVAGGDDAGLFTIDAATGALAFAVTPDYEAPADANGDNVYQLTVSVTDSRSTPVTRDLTVTVTDVAEQSGLTLFDASSVPAQTVTNDPGDYELGVRFSATADGEITGLRYYRGVADSGDTDTRTMNLWNANGTLLASGTIVSDPGEAGWQSVLFSAPVAISGGATYVASYGTTENYSYSGNFFGSGWTGGDGALVAPANAGVFAAGGPGLFPTATYQSANYWVDAFFSTGGAPNEPPMFTSGTSFTVAESTLTVGTLTAADPNGNPLSFAIASGADAAAFSVNATSGVLTFVTPPDYEAPTDANGDNRYEVTVSVSDGRAPPVTQTLDVMVLDQPEPSGASLFAAGELPAQTVTSDSADYELGTRFTANTGGVVTTLRYFRGSADAGDVDTRTLHLWASDGSLLATGTSSAQPGEAGWQDVVLTAPVRLDADASYVVSYGTTQNYAFSSNFFSAARTNADGSLTTPTGAGVFADGTPGLFPSASYQNSNYWVDVRFDADETLFGTLSADTLAGGAGNDILAGGGGNDLLTGGGGSDSFMLADDSGNDVVTDLSQVDVIDLSGRSDASTLATDLAAADVNGNGFLEDGEAAGEVSVSVAFGLGEHAMPNTTLTIDTDSITLKGVGAIDLDLLTTS